MADTTRAYEPGTHPSLPPPITASGPILWVRKNLLGSPLNVILTLLSLYLLYLIVPGILNWAVFDAVRSEEHTSELQSLMRISYAVFCLKKKKKNKSKDNKREYINNKK